MPLVALNDCYGGFELSEEAAALYKKKSGKEFYSFEVKRYCPFLIETIQEMGTEKASGSLSRIYLQDINKEVFDANAWEIAEYDGNEHIKINHESIELLIKKKEEQLLKNNLSEFLKFTLNVINNNDSTDEEKIRAIKDVLTVHNTDDPFRILEDAVNNIKYVPKFGTEYKKVASDFNDLAI